MRTSAPPLLAIFRSQLQGELLAEVFLASAPATLTDIAQHLGAPVTTVQREVSRLERAGILRTVREGRGRMVSADDGNPVVRPLRELVEMSFGPRTVVEQEFSPLTGIEELFVFGSWAARYCGIEGPAPGDVDVLVVGTPDRDDVFDAADRCQRRLHREVNATVMTTARWNGDEPFVAEVRRRPLIELSCGRGSTA